MSLKYIAASIDATLRQADRVVEQRLAETKERDAQHMAHQIAAYVITRAPVGSDPAQLGEAMVQGAVIGEDEVGADGGYLAAPVIAFLEGILEGAKRALEAADAGEVAVEDAVETDEPASDIQQEDESDPVDRALRFFELHNKWPESASPSVVARAKARKLSEWRL